MKRIKNQIKLKTKNFLCFFILFFIAITLQAASWKKLPVTSPGSVGGFMEFNQDGTWTVPVGVTKINVYVVGGGGGGGNRAGGGGGGGSCVKNGATVLVSANGGDGGRYVSSVDQPGKSGEKKSQTLTVTAGTTLNIYVGGGGGAGTYNTTNSASVGGGGGYGNCGNGGNGGANGAVAGGLGGANKGGGGGAGAAAGVASSSSTGGAGSFVSVGGGGLGGSSTLGGDGSFYGAGGGGSGGAGGCFVFIANYYTSSKGSFGSGFQYCNVQYAGDSFSMGFISEPGSPGLNANAVTGGGPGVVIISW